MTTGYILAIVFLTMYTTTIHVKTDVKTRNEAKKVAEDHGLSLTALINIVLKQVARTKHLTLRLDEEEPSDYLIETLKKSEEDIKAGRVSPEFHNTKDAIAWLNR